MRARAEAVSAPDRSPQLPRTEPAPHPAAHGLIVEDGAQRVGPGQMQKSKFLALLRREVCRTAEEALSATGRTTKDCPYLDYWFNYYAAREAGLMERSLVRYAPEAAGAVSAEQYIPAAVERVRRGIAKWVGTGEIDAPKEALQMAEAAPPAKPGNLRMQFKPAPGGAHPPADPHAVRSSLRSGNPLPGDVRTRMETAFGHDFSRVRVHTDEGAGRLSTSLNAHAFTIGSDIAFAPGAFRPGGPAGDALLAHELAHVVQQEGAERQASVAPYGTLEADADRSALAVAASLWGGAKAKLGEIAKNALPQIRSGLSLQRCGCNKSDYPLPTTKIGEVMPDLDCSTPEVTPWDDIRKHANNPDVLGFTRPKAELNIGFEGSWGKKCTAFWKSPPRLFLEYYEVPPPGTYETHIQAPPPPPPPRCKGITPKEVTVLDEPFLERIKAGEREHCEDHKLAYAKTSSRAVQAFDEMASGYCAGASDKDCGEEGFRRFERRLGYSFTRYQQIIQCLFDKSSNMRDKKPNLWHSAVSEPPVYSADCKTLTYRYDPKKTLKEVGKHSSQDVIQGCGE